MIHKGLLALSLAICLIFIVNPSKVKSKENDCDCDFDTPKYTAECDCALACAVAVENGANCNIVCDGSPTSAEHGYYQVFGQQTAYLKKMDSIKGHMLAQGVNAFKNRSFANDALPNLFRSAYIGASFISSEKKIEIDKIVNNAFLKYGKDLWQSFADQDRKTFEKELQKGSSITASYKMIKLTIPNYNISLKVIR